jgi:hypothetical protein
MSKAELGVEGQEHHRLVSALYSDSVLQTRCQEAHHPHGANWVEEGKASRRP